MTAMKPWKFLSVGPCTTRAPLGFYGKDEQGRYACMNNDEYILLLMHKPVTPEQPQPSFSRISLSSAGESPPQSISQPSTSPTYTRIMTSTCTFKDQLRSTKRIVTFKDQLISTTRKKKKDQLIKWCYSLKMWASEKASKDYSTTATYISMTHIICLVDHCETVLAVSREEVTCWHATSDACIDVICIWQGRSKGIRWD